MKFRVKVARMSENGKSAVVTVSQIVKTPFGVSTSQIGIGYVKVDEGTVLPTGFEYVHDGSIKFAPIVDQTTGVVATTKDGSIKHQISFLEEGVPCVWPVTKVDAQAPAVKPVEATDGAVPNEGDEPF